MSKIKRLDTVLGQVLPCQSDPISIVFITRGIIFIFGNCITVCIIKASAFAHESWTMNHLMSYVHIVLWAVRSKYQ